MAVRLAERAVDAIVARLKSQLATELTAIDTERGDGVTMAAPPDANYYAYPKPVIHDGTVHVEVFEEEIEFSNPYSDADAQRATYELPVVVRLTYFNRDNDLENTFVDRARRYGAGVFNVINKSPTLGAADAAIQTVAVQSVTPQWFTDGEQTEKIFKAVTTLELICRCEEVQV